ncbi:nitrilase-related carbon-nitrogen hydrolase [Chloroflexota bacterium]
MVRYNYPKFRVAAVQAGPIIKDAPQWFDLNSTVDKAIRLINEAGTNGARLIVFPECWLPCYPYWSLDLTDRTTFIDIWANLLWSSVEVPGEETQALCAAAKRANAYVVIGINERDRRFQARMHNSILYLSPRGEVMGTHRKICITVQERLFHTPGDGGDNLKTVFRTELGNIGGSICGEHKQLLLIYNWIMQGMQIHCSLWPGHAGLEKTTDIQTRALCNTAGIFGILAATYIPEKDLPKKFYKNSYFNIPQAFRGGSGIINPSGEFIAGPVYDQETIVYSDVDLASTDKVRYSTSLAGIYNRWDLINMNLRQEPYEPLVPMESLKKVSPTPESHQIKDLEAQIMQLEQRIAALSPEMTKDISSEA